MSRLRRIGAVLALCAAAFSWLSAVGAPAASAHPLGNFTVNVYSGLEVSPRAVRIRYVVDMAEIPSFQQGRSIDTDGDGAQSLGERQAWADREAARLMPGLSLRLDGRAVRLRASGATLEVRPGQAGLPTLRLEASYTGVVKTEGSATYEDRNHAGRLGWREITLRSNPGVRIAGSTVPSESVSAELRSYPDDLLASPLDVTSARFSFRPGAGTMEAVAEPGPRAGREGSGLSFASLIAWRLSPTVLALSLLAAFLWGAFHALLPGHGKTITAAYLVGSRAPLRTAVAAGLAVSFMHTASVLALGFAALVLFRSLAAENVYAWLGMVTGLVALGLGIALLASRARRPGHHHHAHDEPGAAVASRGRLAALALAGGMLPSPAAVVVLTGAISLGRLGYGLALIAAFSLGLAAALTLVGVLAMGARAAAERRFHGRWVAAVPVASASAIAGMGAFLVLRGIAQVA